MVDINTPGISGVMDALRAAGDAVIKAAPTEFSSVLAVNLREGGSPLKMTISVGEGGWGRLGGWWEAAGGSPGMWLRPREPVDCGPAIHSCRSPSRQSAFQRRIPTTHPGCFAGVLGVLPHWHGRRANRARPHPHDHRSRRRAHAAQCWLSALMLRCLLLLCAAGMHCRSSP